MAAIRCRAELAQEPLELSAALAYELAPQLCRGGDDRGCAWLHGFWPCLRLAGLAATPDRHAGFYGAALRALGPSAGVLISGAADQGMLALVLAALPDASVTVIDSCETPLQLNRRYAEHVGREVQTKRCSVLDYTPQAPFDLVCTHSFFGQFSREERPRLVAAWRGLLRPGGRVVTAHPLRPSGADEPNRFTSRQETVFREQIAQHAGRLAGALGAQLAEVHRLADAYLRARYGYPVRSAGELAALFEAAGFDIEQLASGLPPLDAPAGCGGPGLRNAEVQYAHVIARRR